jgi:hypothetical protein
MPGAVMQLDRKRLGKSNDWKVAKRVPFHRNVPRATKANDLDKTEVVPIGIRPLGIAPIEMSPNESGPLAAQSRQRMFLH